MYFEKFPRFHVSTYLDMKNSSEASSLSLSLSLSFSPLADFSNSSLAITQSDLPPLQFHHKLLEVSILNLHIDVCNISLHATNSILTHIRRHGPLNPNFDPVCYRGVSRSQAILISECDLLWHLDRKNGDATLLLELWNFGNLLFVRYGRC